MTNKKYFTYFKEVRKEINETEDPTHNRKIYIYIDNFLSGVYISEVRTYIYDYYTVISTQQTNSDIAIYLRNLERDYK